jgi:Na+-transporting NADH:ubiquinone oxidoreductase subunit C
LPIFVYKDENGNKKYIIPVRGKGLWGQIWGYVAINDDLNTIYGAVFDHAKETPGLGAEINQDWFMNEFKGKKLFDDNGNFISIEVVKGGGADPADPHAVDAISGGTITSKGLEDMLKDSLAPYVNYFEKLLGS